MDNVSLLQRSRLCYCPSLPKVLRKLSEIDISFEESISSLDEIITTNFPLTHGQPVVRLQSGSSRSSKGLTVGVVLSGGQAPGGHNVITGLFDALNNYHSSSRLIGFLGGPSGIVNNRTQLLTRDVIDQYRNLGGFDIIGSGRTKIETEEQLNAALYAVNKWKLDGLLIIGGDDSNTNAAILAEHFRQQQCNTVVIGVPKTIDGDLKNEWIEIPFGFDTACKIYSEIIGNICRDSISAQKYYHFIRLMGRSASHITLECALQTHPNMALIGEEIAAAGTTLTAIVNQVSDLIECRKKEGKNFGVILVPEGLLEFIPEFRHLMKELNRLLVGDNANIQQFYALPSVEDKINWIQSLLTQASRHCYAALPKTIQLQLLLDRDDHGNVRVSQIETEKLLIDAVTAELQRRGQGAVFSCTGSFSWL